MDPAEIAPGLFRWEAAHPAWTPEEDWPQMVGCLLYELGERVVLIDPLIPSEGREGSWRGWTAVWRAGR